jgi:hypothetical protein
MNNDSFRINLSSLIPYNLQLDKEEKNLVLTKGVLKGTVSLTLIELEIQRQLDITIEKLSFKKEQKGTISLNSKEPLAPAVKEQISIIISEVISKNLPRTLSHKSTHNPMIYLIREVIGIPLIGSLYFGVIDRGTTTLQVRPITGCPLNCPYCSVDEGPASRSKIREFVVDPDYLLETYNYVTEQKNESNLEAHIDGQGEPSGYPYLVDLVEGLARNKRTNTISLQTNGWFLTESLIDKLTTAGLSRVNLSINAMEPALAKKLAGRGDYNLEKVLEMARYIAQSSVSLLIAPLWIPEINDDEVKPLIEFSKEINSIDEKYPTMGIQNYLYHPQGRNIKGVTVKKMEQFNEELRELENEMNQKDLYLTPEMFNNYKTRSLEIPFQINEIVTAETLFPGRLENEIIAKIENRLVHVRPIRKAQPGKKIQIRITRNRHNIFFAEPV